MISWSPWRKEEGKGEIETDRLSETEGIQTEDINMNDIDMGNEYQLIDWWRKSGVDNNW